MHSKEFKELRKRNLAPYYLLEEADELRNAIETNIQLFNNINTKDFKDCDDEKIREYLLKINDVELNFSNMCERLKTVSEYCKKIIKWISDYNES